MGCRRAPRQCSSILAKPRCHRTTSVFVVARACACACSRRHHGRLIAAETNIAACSTPASQAICTRHPFTTYAAQNFLCLGGCNATAKQLQHICPEEEHCIVRSRVLAFHPSGNLVLVACPARARLLGAPSLPLNTHEIDLSLLLVQFCCFACPWAGRFVVTNTSWTKRSFLLTPGSCFFHNGCRQFAILSQRFGSGRRQHCCGIGQRRPSRPLQTTLTEHVPQRANRQANS